MTENFTKDEAKVKFIALLVEQLWYKKILTALTTLISRTGPRSQAGNLSSLLVCTSVRPGIRAKEYLKIVKRLQILSQIN